MVSGTNSKHPVSSSFHPRPPVCSCIHPRLEHLRACHLLGTMLSAGYRRKKRRVVLAMLHVEQGVDWPLCHNHNTAVSRSAVPDLRDTKEALELCRGQGQPPERECLSSVVKGKSRLPQEARLRWAFLPEGTESWGAWHFLETAKHPCDLCEEHVRVLEKMLSLRVQFSELPEENADQDPWASKA